MINPIKKIVDVHSHVLPMMDDGSKSLEMSVEMLIKANDAGTEKMVLTSHFYPHKESIDSFTKRREESLKILLDGIKNKNVPKLSIGAEVYYFYGISAASDIRELCYTGSDFLLIEMPFSKWNRADIDEIERLMVTQNVLPIIAHFERFIDFGNMKYIKQLKKMGCLIQTNSEFIIEKDTRKKALKLIKKGFIDLIGSDAHNTESRPINIKECVDILTENLSLETLDRLFYFSRIINKNTKNVN